jgi:hypothetical protein
MVVQVVKTNVLTRSTAERFQTGSTAGLLALALCSAIGNTDTVQWAPFWASAFSGNDVAVLVDLLYTLSA